MTVDEFLGAVSGRLIVSCQAGHDHPLRDTATIVRLAQCAVAGGAAAIRCGGVGGIADVRAVARSVAVPVIGLTKQGTEGVYITPTVDAAVAVIEAGADVVAVDATRRPRPDGRPLTDTVQAIHLRGRLVMADVATVAEGVAAAEDGVDLISTTLSGYTTPGATPADPDIALVAALSAVLPSVPIIAEGRYHHPAQAVAAVAQGATAVVVGTAITDPMWITENFAAAIASISGPTVSSTHPPVG